MRRALSFFALLSIALVIAAAATAEEITFKKIPLDDKFRSEGCSVGDFNGDGKLDISAGYVYYAAPDWKLVPVIDNPEVVDPHGYSKSFCNFAEDINGDGRTDLIVVDFPGARPGGSSSRRKTRTSGSGTKRPRSRITKAPAGTISPATRRATCCLPGNRGATSVLPNRRPIKTPPGT